MRAQQQGLFPAFAVIRRVNCTVGLNVWKEFTQEVHASAAGLAK
jgi:hypothetical protein